MRPELFSAFELGFPSYSMLLLSGFLFATTVGVLWARRIGENPDIIVDLGLSTLIAGVVGARILHVIADGHFWEYVHICTDPSLVDWKLTQAECASPTYAGVWDAAKAVCHPKEADCLAWAKFWNGGYTYYGGFIAAVASSWYLLRRDRFPFWRAADMAGFAIPLGLAFGRMGCVLAGCCFGLRTDGAFGLSFPPNSPASEAQFNAHELATRHLASLPVHPTQIYESAVSLLIATICLVYVHPRKRYDGQVFLAFVVLYAVARFVLETLRNDDRGGLFGLSTSQLLGVIFAASAVSLHVVLSRRTRAPVAPVGGAQTE